MEEKSKKESRNFYEPVFKLMQGDFRALLEDHEPLFRYLGAESRIDPVVTFLINIALLSEMVKENWIPIRPGVREVLMSNIVEIIVQTSYSDEYKEFIKRYDEKQEK